jgi:chromosome partitioning protein
MQSHEFQKLVEMASKRGQKLLEIVFDDSHKVGSKTLLTPNFTIARAAEIIGCSTDDISQLESEGRLGFKLRRVRRGSVRMRVLNYNEINLVRDALGLRPSRPEGAKCKRVVVQNLKGGVAKSTHAIHLAHYAASKGYKVLMVDADPQGTTTASFGIIPDLHLSDGEDLSFALLRDPKMIRDAVRKTNWADIDLVPARIELEFVDWEMTINLSCGDTYLGPMPLRLHRALQVVEDDYDLIVIDTPPSLGVLSLNTITAASIMVMPIAPRMFEIGSSIKYFEILSTVLSHYGGLVSPEKLAILLTKVDKRETTQRHLQQLRVCFDDMIMQSTMGKSEAFQKTTSHAMSLYETPELGSAEKRARNMLDTINDELLGEIKALWEQEADRSWEIEVEPVYEQIAAVSAGGQR